MRDEPSIALIRLAKELLNFANQENAREVAITINDMWLLMRMEFKKY